jgi:ATP-dependent helicase/nuclease subunit A
MKAKNIRLITASAGSGKTYRLTSELSALLNDTDSSAYQPSEVIATTFTRAAASELRNRVRERVLQQGAYEIASLLDQSLIGTVNSISDQLLLLFAFDIGLPPVQRVVEDEEKNLLFQKSLTISLDEETAEKLDAVSERLWMQRRHINRLIQSIADMARSNGIDDEGLRRSKQDSIDSLKRQLPEPVKDFKEIKSALMKEIPTLREQVNAVKDTTKSTEKCLSELEGFHYRLRNELPLPWAQWLIIAEQLEPAQKSVKAGVFDNVIRLAADHLETPEFQQDLFDCIAICFDTAIKTLKNYKSLKTERGLLDFVDQEAFLIEALDNVQVRARFQELFKVLMVDEFQDTSPIQLSLFAKMASLVDKVIWVGDSKQAIYGFRGSDAALIDTVIENLGRPGPDDILRNSYRSRPELVQLVNDLFVPAFKSNHAHITADQISLQATRKPQHQLQAAFQLWNFGKEVKGTYTNDIYYNHLAARVSSFIKEGTKVEDPGTKNIRPLAPGDIAILCRTNAECREIANALRDNGLQAVVSNTGISLTAEWRWLRSCMHVLVDETDTLSKAEIIFLHQSDHNIESLLDERLEFIAAAGDDKFRRNEWMHDYPVILWIKENRSRLLAEPVSGMIQLIYAGLQFHNKVIEWGNGAQRQANLQQVIEYARQFEDHCLKLGLLPNVHGFLSWFETLAENEQDKRGPVTNKLSVNVLTYHMSKGLEWPVVMLTGLDRKHEPDVFQVRVMCPDNINFEDPLKGRSIRFWTWPYKVGLYGQKGQYKYKAFCEDTKEFASLAEKQALEALRLLYVGFTRARDYLLIAYKEEKLEWLESVLPEGVNALTGNPSEAMDTVVTTNKFFKGNFRLWRTVYTGGAATLAETSHELRVYRKGGPRKFPPYFINPSAAEEVSEYSFNESAAVGEGIGTNGVQIEEKSAFGTFIHQFMCAFQSSMSDSETKALVKRLATNADVTIDEQVGQVAAQARNFFQWIATFRPKKIYKELPLMMEREGQLINGIADLVIETDEQVILIDYKTFTGDDAALRYKAQTFSGQLKIYEEVLRKYFSGKEIRMAIYFIMAGKLVWMQPGRKGET